MPEPTIHPTVTAATDVATRAFAAMGADVRPDAAGPGSLAAYWPPTGHLPVVIHLLPPKGARRARAHVRLDRLLTAPEATRLATMAVTVSCWLNAVAPFDPEPPTEQGSLL